MQTSKTQKPIPIRKNPILSPKSPRKTEIHIITYNNKGSKKPMDKKRSTFTTKEKSANKEPNGSKKQEEKKG